MNQISRAALLQQFKTTNYIGLAMIGAVFIYAGIVLGVGHGVIPLKLRPALHTDISTKIKYVLLFISLFHYLVIKFFQKIALKAANRLPAASMLTFALCEAVSIYGLVLFFLSGNANDFFIFMTISLFYFFIFYPKYADWERTLAQEPQAKPSRSQP